MPVEVVNGNSTPETMTDCAFPLRADDGSGNRQAVAFDARQSDVIQYGEKAWPLDTDAFSQGVQLGAAVRRLMPVECARLQGFPDDYLDITFRGKPAADGNKYRALGNSMAVNVMRWIGDRIATE